MDLFGCVLYNAVKHKFDFIKLSEYNLLQGLEQDNAVQCCHGKAWDRY